MGSSIHPKRWKESDPRPAGRGVLWLSGAKLFFVLSGFVVQFGLPRLFHAHPEQYGLLSAGMVLVTTLTNSMSASMVQTTSRLIAQAESASAAKSFFFRHALIGLGLALAFAIGSTPLATRWFRDLRLVPLFELGSLVVCSYAIYSTAIGVLNGKQRFMAQALLDALFSLLRTIGLLGGAWAAQSALSSMGGLATAAALAAISGLALSLSRDASCAPPLGAHLQLLWRIAAYQLALNGLLQLDLEFLGGAFSSKVSHLGPEKGAFLSAQAIASYRAAQAISFVPYQLLMGLILTILPTISRAHVRGDFDAVRHSSALAIRGGAVFALGTLSVLASLANETVAFVFPPAFSQAARVLPLLCASQSAFCIAVLQATILIGCGEEKKVALFAGVALGSGGIGWLLAWFFASVDALPLWIGGATLFAHFLFALLTAILIKIRLGLLASLSSFMRLLPPALLTIASGKLVRALPLATPLALILLGGLFVLLAIAFGSLQPAELKIFVSGLRSSPRPSRHEPS
ncbi:MAG: lipopolysaccharide biosynthesis protein [Deltaproteobacteria bacterium]|nr:lipopolysaccharide biosynthesis protein [Sandaracinaceae bacterium]MCX7807598.1 lipopolysaccharide biosynthesis protein [Deltaproteobacteria bacterium]MDW8246400.1 lipopolysaccharide biosynthesis protein [Sandaracinaceae bacterium]